MQVPEEKTLISPVQCKSLWRQFKAETEFTVTQAIAAQVSHMIHFCKCFLCDTNNVVPIISKSFVLFIIL
jgi:hypothetical protein